MDGYANNKQNYHTKNEIIMSWKDTKSVKRIFNTFKRLKTQIFNEDIEALKQLNESLLDSQKTYVNDNILFAKLLCVILRQNLHHFGSMKIAIKKTNDELSMPIENHLLYLTKELNHNEKLSYFKSLGIDLESYKSPDEIIKDNQKEIVEKLNTSWSYQNVEKSFYNTANDFLKDINNY